MYDVLKIRCRLMSGSNNYFFSNIYIKKGKCSKRTIPLWNILLVIKNINIHHFLNQNPESLCRLTA